MTFTGAAGVLLLCMLAASVRANIFDAIKCTTLGENCKEGSGENGGDSMAAPLDSAPAGAVDHSLWDDVVKSIVIPNAEREGIQFNAINYDLLRTDAALRQKHDAYINMLSKVDFKSLPKDEAVAFLINAYNAFTVDVIVKENPESSIRDLSDASGAVFDRFKWTLTVDGQQQEVSLNDVEHRLLRGEVSGNDEPRIHAAVNCASLSCPDLRAEAYTGDKLEDQLQEQMIIWLQNEGKGLRVDKENNEIHMSTIFGWFRDDFVSTDAGGKNDLISTSEPIDYALQFATEEVKAFVEANSPTVKLMPYNWGLVNP
ncbi:hypothetical protein BSKO_08871 [Bryopsis sp. KO-2023]|nr:hypothetical protein BSKO_08871 [Bryopsis sp. KO-2023]